MRNQNNKTNSAGPNEQSKRKGPGLPDNSWVMAAFNLGAFPPLEVDLDDAAGVESFRRKVAAEQSKVLKFWVEGPHLPLDRRSRYLTDRFKMFGCLVTRAIYILEMMHAVESAFGFGVAAGMLRRASLFLWRRLGNKNLAAYYSLALAEFGAESGKAQFVVDMCKVGLANPSADQQVHCLPELRRLYAQVLLDSRQLSKARKQIQLAEDSAAGHPYYMPALWNRIYSCKAVILGRQGDGEGAAETKGRVGLNHRLYSDADNSDSGAAAWLRWFSARPPMVRPGRPVG
jgi:hypothetical protein